MSPLLEYWLGRHYTARALGKGDTTQTRDVLMQRLQADQTLAAEAKLELERIEALAASCGGDLWKRCYVSSIHAEALRHALAP
ncbi:MAG: hypothetical protein ACREQ5_09185 [Candidatus Dormibacteria bacterium]